MAVYVVRWFRRWMDQYGLAESDLCRAVQEMAKGLIDARLGGGLVKKRVARNGQGKRGGFRTIVATRQSGHWFFVYGFTKSDQANMDRQTEQDCREVARHFLSLDTKARECHVDSGQLFEMDCDAQVPEHFSADDARNVLRPLQEWRRH